MTQPIESRTSFTRRKFLRLLGGAALAPVAAGAAADGAEAARTWCRTDPVVKIDGKVADVWLSSYQELHETATGPSQIVVSVPPGVSTELLATDLGFGRHGYVVSFQEDPSLRWNGRQPSVAISVYTPSGDSSLPLRVDFTPRSSRLTAARANGSVNQWITLQTG
jgi:hypothetical protein